MNPPRAIVEEVLEDACVASPTLAVATSSMSSDSSAVSPKRNSRIEDSVQAIDALTEALEELESSLPMIMNDAEVVPFKATSASPEPKPEANTTKKRISSAPIRKKPALQEPQRQSTQLRNVKVSPPKLTMTDGELITGLRTQDSKPSLPTSKRMSESSTTRKASIYRVASIVKAPFVPFKSTKPPTQSTFVLPGDAITARKKAAHEARLIREEEEKKTKREFKARPVPFRSSIGGAPAPRPTIASQKRKSLARGIEIAEMKGSSNVAKKIIQIPPSRSSIAVQRSAIQPKAATKSLVRVKPSSKPGQRVIPASQNEELPFKKPTPALSTTTKSFARTVSVKSIARSKVAVSPPAKAIAKTKPLTDREKGDAAKNARAEAAERGRQASREWAEKERKKRQSLAKLKADTQH